MPSRKALPIIGGAIAIFTIVLAYNWAHRKSPDTFVRNSQSQITALEKDLSSLRAEQADLAKDIDIAAYALLKKQMQFEGRMAQDADEKAAAVWGSYRTGCVLNRRMVLQMGATLDALRGATNDLDRGGIETLRAVQRIISPGPTSSGSKSSNELLTAAQRQLSLLDPALSAAIQLAAEAKNEISSQDLALKEQERKVQALVPVGASRSDPITDGIFGALELTLKDNQAGQKLLLRLDKSSSGFAKLAFAVKDVARAQSEFIPAAR